MNRFFLLLGFFGALVFAAEAPNPPSSGPQPIPVDQGEELHTAPQVQTGNAPPERQLSPPPDAEKSLLPSGFTELVNPAFPRQAKPNLPVKPSGRRYEPKDLSAYFARGPSAEAKTAFDRGQYARARQLLAKQGGALPVRYLRALSSLQAGDARTAAEEFVALAHDYSVLRDRCVLEAALAFEALGQWEQAAAWFHRIAVGSKLYVEARFGLSRVQHHLKDLRAASEALVPISLLPAPGWGRDVGAEAALALADLARERKDAGAEKEALLNLWANHPLSSQSLEAEKRLRCVRPSLFYQTLRGEQLVDAHRNAAGIKELKPVVAKLALPDSTACRAHFAFGKALRKERLHAQAIRVLLPVVERCQDPDLRARALYVLASSQSILDPAGGIRSYETLAHEYPAHTFADDALFYAADLYAKLGQTERAQERLSELIEQFPNGDFLSEALFKNFWIERSQKHIDAAFGILDRIEKLLGGADESYDVERARYWRARMLRDLGRKDESVRLLEALVLEHPSTYYGLLARQQLAEWAPIRWEAVRARMGEIKANGNAWPLASGTLAEDSHFLAGIELLRLGMGDAASVELLAANRSHQPPEAIRLLVQALAAAGDFRSAHAIARTSLRQDLSGPMTSRTRPVWEIAYPLAFRNLVERHCEDAKVNPDLLQGLMREESALDPKALSWAGALGLTQLMLSTAKQVARSHKLGKVTAAMLLDPGWNIRLGCLELGALLRTFKGVEAYALAGYNAGPNAVAHWKAARPQAELDEWVEEIPIAETRGYVKRVLRSYNTYQLLYPHPTNVSAMRDLAR